MTKWENELRENKRITIDIGICSEEQDILFHTKVGIKLWPNIFPPCFGMKNGDDSFAHQNIL